MPSEADGPGIKPFRRRSRRGCLVCREHRSKCDEKTPTCGGCYRLGRTCKWGLRVSFHPSRASQLSISDSKFLREVELERRHQNALTFVDETDEIECGYNGANEISVQQESSQEERHTRTSRAQNNHHTVPVGDSFSQSSPEESISASRRTGGPQTLQYLRPQSPHTPNPPIYTTGNNTSVVTVPFQRSRHGDVPEVLAEEVLSWPVNDHLKARLLSAYFQGASRWCEVTDSTKSFSTLSSMMVESPAFAAAAAALASIVVMKTDEFHVLLADELYIFARRTLRGLESEHRGERLLATTLLCKYCSALGKTVEEQSTLYECAEILESYSLQDAPHRALTACFWVFARQDIWASYLHGRPTIIPTDSWKVTQLDPNDTIQDSYSNLAIWITARIVNELSKQPADINSNTLHQLWAELQMWVIERPLSVRCVMEIESSGDSPFPTILFSNPSAACGNLYYHIGCILLLTTGLLPHQTSAMASPICHARRIAAISITSNDHANLVNNIHPLCVAARQLPVAVEKIAIMKHLREIEDCTGWKTESIQKPTQIRDYLYRPPDPLLYTSFHPDPTPSNAWSRNLVLDIGSFLPFGAKSHLRSSDIKSLSPSPNSVFLFGPNSGSLLEKLLLTEPQNLLQLGPTIQSAFYKTLDISSSLASFNSKPSLNVCGNGFIVAFKQCGDNA